MRFIIKEQPYEKPLTAGLFRYEQDGEATGAVEHWRLTEAASGFRFLRVDLDARAAQSGSTYLYHAVLNEYGRIERLKYRFWGNVEGDRLQVTGDVVLEEESVIATREVNGEKYEQLFEIPAGYGFWFPSSVGVGMFVGWLVGLPAGGPKTAVTLETSLNDKSSALSLFLTEIECVSDANNSHTLRWANKMRTVWLDEQGWPVKMKRDDGLTAVAIRQIHYA